MGNVIVPRASGKKSEAEQAIQIYYEENDWLTNADFIQRYKAQFGSIGQDNDNTAYTKRTQIGAYFGFIEWEDISNNKSRRRITPRGRTFWEHILANDTDAIHEDLMKSLEEISFGRRNYACPSGDTDIEPPAVFFHAALELEYITNDEFACLLWLLDSENKPFDQAIEYIRKMLIGLTQHSTRCSDSSSQS